ncbi:bifunctional metallophosphatase/5'-nucleotidase [Ferrimonas aestuarii]|nr:bifunctional metallophosphatase/5'-nucleotidase [Ferrimonas aestuarii]
MMKLQKSMIAISLMAALSACSDSDTPPPAQVENFELTIAHVNDTHSTFDPVRSSFLAGEDNLVYNEFGGYPRLLEAANKVKSAAAANNDSVLFLHGGDAWQGSAYFKLNDGRANADLLSQMGIDAMALGNHEFDLTTTELADFIDTVTFPVLANNIDASADAALGQVSNLKPYQLFAFNGNMKREISSASGAVEGEKVVAVIGVVLEDLQDISTGTGDVTFSSEITATQATVDALKADGVNQIIVLSHIGLQRDQALAAGVNGIDVIVGGHSHTLLGDFTDLGKGNPGAYAELVTNADGKGKTCIVQAGELAQAIGKVNVEFNPEGELVQCAGNNTLLSNDTFFTDALRGSDSLVIGNDHQHVIDFIDAHKQITVEEENADLRAHIDAFYKPAVDAAYGEVIAAVPAEINHERRPGDANTDAHGSDVAPLVGEAEVFWANQDAVKAVTGLTAQIGLVGAGGVRTNIGAGDFREGNSSLELLPFSNQLSVLSLSGAEIKTLLETTITPTLDKAAHAGKFPYVGGMRYTFTESVKGVSGSITQLQVNTGTEAAPVWADIVDGQDYVVVINGYNVNGRDGWTAMGDAQVGSTDRVDVVIENGEYVGYPVDSLTKNVADDGAISFTVNYKDGNAPDCKADGVRCNTDAQSFIDYSDAKGILAPLPFETVTIKYMD